MLDLYIVCKTSHVKTFICLLIRCAMIQSYPSASGLHPGLGGRPGVLGWARKLISLKA
jgi:hypothetical protein